MFQHEKKSEVNHLEKEGYNFKKAKQEALDFINGAREGQNEFEGEIDNGIMPLVEKFNKLNFLYTVIGSCEGHVRSRESLAIKYPDIPIEKLRMLPPDGLAQYFPGYIHIATDKSNDAESFITQIRAVINRYPDARIIKMARNEEVYFNLENGFDIELDDPNKSTGRRNFMSLSQAQERKRLSNSLIKELESLADSFI